MAAGSAEEGSYCSDWYRYIRYSGTSRPCSGINHASS